MYAISNRRTGAAKPIRKGMNSAARAHPSQVHTGHQRRCRLSDGWIFLARRIMCERSGNVSCVQLGQAWPRGNERYPIAALSITGNAITKTK